MIQKNLEDKIIMVGAGLAGSLMATYLNKQGFSVELYEKNSDMRKEVMSAGKSINLALSQRGIRPLEEIGVIDEIMKIAIPMKGRMIHNINGDLKFQPYGKDDTEVINSVSRAKLNMVLMDSAEKTGKTTIHFNKPCIDFNPTNGSIVVVNLDTGDKEEITGQTVIAADGAGSALRYVMQKLGRFDYQQSFLEHGYKELNIPADENGDHKIEKNALHIWPGKRYMLIALPNPDGTFTATLFLPFEGKNGFHELESEDKIINFFNDNFPDVIDLMPTLVTDFMNNPSGILGTIRCNPWYVEDKALLLGDAAHAIVPFYGQGMNAAFEDCVELNNLIKENGSNWKEIYPKFNEARKINVEAIADLALENFIEMRDSVADKHFLMIKEAELRLYKAYPNELRSKYSMITFSDLSYSEAKHKGEILFEEVSKLCLKLDDVNEFDLKMARFNVLEKYKSYEKSKNK